MCKYDYACVYLCITYASDWDWEYVHDEPQRLGREGRPCMVKCSNKRKKKKCLERSISGQSAESDGKCCFFSLSVKRLYLMCDVFSPRRGGMVQLIWRLKTRLWLF